MSHVSYSEVIEATPQQIWTIISDATRLPEWAYKDGPYPHLVESRYGNDQTEGVGTLWVGTSSDGQSATQRITAWETNQKLVYELDAVENAALQMAQTNSFSLESEDAATRVIWDVDWELTGGFSLNSLLIRFTGNGSFEEMMAGSLENLKQLVERETAQSQPDSDDSSEAEES
ncbi:MAG: SRPBCC family protein [Chloroflexota bacterium]